MSTTTEPLPTKSTALTINRIKSLVHHWMSIWDMNTGDATPLIEVLSPEGFQINASTVQIGRASCRERVFFDV
jgi:hypothetical protein